jgi:hypothetical protein
MDAGLSQIAELRQFVGRKIQAWMMNFMRCLGGDAEPYRGKECYYHRRRAK